MHFALNLWSVDHALPSFQRASNNHIHMTQKRAMMVFNELAVSQTLIMKFLLNIVRVIN
jgi:hypothetical protein